MSNYNFNPEPDEGCFHFFIRMIVTFVVICWFILIFVGGCDPSCY